MNTSADGNEFLHGLEFDVKTELTLAEIGHGQQEVDDILASEGLRDPDAERYEVRLRSILGAIEALEDGSS